MPKQFIKRYTPHHDTIRNHRHLQFFGRLLHDPNLWHLNRRSVSGAFAAGLFWSMVPMPFQMIPAAASAILFRVNMPISVALVWITNPFTMTPIYYFTYLVGVWLLDQKASVTEFELSSDWISQSLGLIWEPLLLGSLFVGTILSITGYTLMRLIWRWHVVKKHRQRNLRIQ